MVEVSRKRLFVAVAMPDKVREHVARWMAGAPHTGARWVPIENLHLTLAFLGRADGSAVGSALKGLVVPQMHLQLATVGAFPSRRAARVLWIGVEGDVGTLSALAKEVTRRLAPCAPEMDSKTFHPHVTVARYRLPRRLPPLLPFPPIDFEAREAILMESMVGSEGAVYRKVAAFGT